MLPDDDWVFIEIGYVGPTNAFWGLLHDHPAEVAVEEAFADGVRILVCIGIAVMGTVVTGPPADGAFNSAAANGSEENAEGKSSRV